MKRSSILVGSFCLTGALILLLLNACGPAPTPPPPTVTASPSPDPTLTAAAEATDQWAVTLTASAQKLQATYTAIAATQVLSRSSTATAYWVQGEVRFAVLMACGEEGQPVPEAAAYQSGAGPHPVIFEIPSTEDYSTEPVLEGVGSLPAELRVAPLATGLSDAQLLVCVHDRMDEIEGCSYSGNHGIWRRCYSRVIEVIILQTGATLAWNSFPGPYPDPCPANYSFSQPGSIYFDGPREYDREAASAWLASVLAP